MDDILPPARPTVRLVWVVRDMAQFRWFAADLAAFAHASEANSHLPRFFVAVHITDCTDNVNSIER